MDRADGDIEVRFRNGIDNLYGELCEFERQFRSFAERIKALEEEANAVDFQRVEITLRDAYDRLAGVQEILQNSSLSVLHIKERCLAGQEECV